MDSPRLECGERWIELKQRGSRDTGVGLHKLQLDFSQTEICPLSAQRPLCLLYEQLFLQKSELGSVEPMQRGHVPTGA